MEKFISLINSALHNFPANRHMTLLFYCVYLEQMMDVLHTIPPRMQEKQDLQSTIFGKSYSCFTENSDHVKYFLNFL